MPDRVGLGWRPALAAGILANLDRVDVVEVMIEDYLAASRRERRALRTLAAQVPVVLHGVSLGLASAVRVEPRRLEPVARLVGDIEPEFWSEHLAFVRGGGVEIGHLAAPPRTAATVEGTARNLAAAAVAVGAVPLVENVATLIDPPGSDRDEATWVAEILAVSGGRMLLDLHNLYANALNFGWDPRRLLDRVPADRVAAIHLAGGRWIGSAAQGRRLLDDHLHEVPEPVYDLLREVGHRVPRPLTVILERDGAFPPVERLLAELDRARAALAAGRLFRHQPDPRSRAEGAGRREVWG
jgi:uncharacterized protein (UPF0276 family)